MREHAADQWQAGPVTFRTVMFRSADDQSAIAELRHSNTGERLGTCTATPGSAEFVGWVTAMVAAGRARAAEIAG